MILKDFKIKSEADDTYHLEHPSGKTFTVDKKELSEKARNAIQKLCAGGQVQKFNDGGAVEPEVTPTPAPAQADESSAPTPTPLPPPQAGASASWTPEPAIPAAAAPVSSNSTDPLMQGKLDTDLLLNRQEGDIKKFQGDLDAAGAKEQAARQEGIDQLSEMQTPDEIAAEYKGKDDALMKHFMDQKIDPNRYMNNKSTGSKILSGIAMAISGLGAGSSGRNLAYETIQKAIDNDIQSQRDDKESSYNLWKMNREQMHDDLSAHLATQNQLMTAVQAKVAMAAGQTQNMQAKFNMQMMLNQLEQQKVANRQRLGLLTQGSSGGVSNADPLSLVPEMVPAEHQKAAITEIGQAKAASEHEDQMMKLFDQAKTENTALKTGFGKLRTPGSILTLTALGDPLIHDQDGRVNEFEKRDFENLLPQPGDTDSKIEEKRKGLQMFINNKKAAPTAKSFGINVDNFASTTSNPVARLGAQEQRMYQIAKAHPNDPASQAFFKKYGVK